jgi:hypothetical protein
MTSKPLDSIVPRALARTELRFDHLRADGTDVSGEGAVLQSRVAT